MSTRELYVWMKSLHAAAVDVAAKATLIANAVTAAPAIGNSVDCEGDDTCAGDS